MNQNLYQFNESEVALIKIYVIGSINMDLVVVTKNFPKKGETVTGQSFFTNAGGKGANQAVAISKMGSNVELVGAVGKEFGEELIQTLNHYNVSTRFVKRLDNVSSGTATILISNGDNRIILNPAANYAITEEDIDRALIDAKEGDYLLCQLEIPASIVTYAFKKAKQIGMVTFLNPAPAIELSETIFQTCDYLIPNQTEAEFYTDIYPHSVEDARMAALTFLSKGVKNVILTLGDKGAYFYNGTIEHFQPIKALEAVDTTAAGDSYIGAVITYLSERRSIKEAMEVANRAASLTIQRLGAQQAIPYRNELE